MADTKSDAVTPLEGKTSIDDKMFFEPERLSYVSAAAIADKISVEVGEAVKGKVVVIAGTQLLVDLTNLQAVYLRLESLKKEYAALFALSKRVLKKRPELESTLELATRSREELPPTTEAVASVGVAIEAAIGLVSLLREDVEYRGAKTSVDALAFEIALGARLKAHEAARVFIPDLMVIESAKTDDGSLSKRLEAVQAARTTAWQLIGPLVAELVRLEADLDRAVREKDQAQVDALTTKISELRRDMQPVSDPLSRADRTLADLQTQWNQADDSKVTVLARLLRAEVIGAKKPLYLHVKVVSSGGHHRISRNLLRMLFLGDGLSFAGGSTVRWALLCDEGGIEKGDILVERHRSSYLFGDQRVT